LGSGTVRPISSAILDPALDHVLDVLDGFVVGGSHDAEPPGALLVDLAQALGVTTDEMLGADPLREKGSARHARIRKRLQRVGDLPVGDQRAVLKFVVALVESRNIENGS
jgi:hypothetical protein